MKYCTQCSEKYAKAMRYCPADGQLLSLPDPYHLVGQVLNDNYRIEALVAIGGMGAVYNAQHLGTDRKVAFKILQPNLAYANESVMSLFEREAKLASRFFHENIAIVFDAGRAADHIAYIAMEWLEGQTLEDELTAKGPISLERTADILRQIANALETAHDGGIVHRDLKPSNIMLVRRRDGREQVKVLDFGIGKVVSESGSAAVSILAGTPQYASPEQFQKDARIDHRTDLYSLGVVLYQMLTGVLPYTASSADELSRLQQSAPPKPLRKLLPEAPLPIEALLTAMLDKEPSHRPARASDVSAFFERALQDPKDVLLTSDLRNLRDENPTPTPSPVAPKNVGHPPRKGQFIYKYPLRGNVILEENFVIELPEGAQILCVQTQNGSPFIWAMVDPSRASVRRRLRMVATGDNIAESNQLVYIGTFQLEQGAYIFHLFEHSDQQKAHS
jgi:serine/threonine-protein kinase